MKQRSDGRWVKKITINGKPHFFYSTESTERKAEKDIQQQLISYTETEHRKKHNIKCLADKMLTSKEHSISHYTYTAYENAIKHLSPFFDYDIEDITLKMAQTLLDNLSRQNYGYWSIQKTKTVLGLIFKEAILNGSTVHNFCSDLTISKSLPKTKVHSPDDTVINLITQNHHQPFGLWALLLLSTGFRRGEVAAIQNKDIDFKNKTINLWRSVEFIHNQAHLKNMPKTASGVRTVPILDILYSPLYEHCKKLKDTDFIFGIEKPLSLTMIRKRWAKYEDIIGVKVKQHQLRHAYAFLLYRAGVDVKTAQYLLGHSDYKVTMNIYTDFDDTLKSQSAQKINEFMSNTF